MVLLTVLTFTIYVLLPYKSQLGQLLCKLHLFEYFPLFSVVQKLSVTFFQTLSGDYELF